MPINFRRWYIGEIVSEMKQSRGDDPEDPKPIRQSRAKHHNDAETRAMQGKSRAHVPSRLIRFT